MHLRGFDVEALHGLPFYLQRDAQTSSAMQHKPMLRRDAYRYDAD
jgi:hypothetical protein